MAKIGCRTCAGADYTPTIHELYTAGKLSAINLQKDPDFHPDIPWRVLNFGGRADGPRGCTPSGKDCDEWRKQQCWGESLYTSRTKGLDSIGVEVEGARRPSTYDPYVGRPFCTVPTQRAPYATPVQGEHMCDRYYAAAGRSAPNRSPVFASLLAALIAYFL